MNKTRVAPFGCFPKMRLGTAKASPTEDSPVNSEYRPQVADLQVAIVDLATCPPGTTPEIRKLAATALREGRSLAARNAALTERVKELNARVREQEDELRYRRRQRV